MKISELPEEYKIYTLELSNGKQHNISGKQKQSIMNARTNFLELASGSIINKAFVIEMRLNFEETRKNAQQNKSLLTTT